MRAAVAPFSLLALVLALAGCVERDRDLCPPDVTASVSDGSRDAPTAWTVTSVGNQRWLEGRALASLAFEIELANGTRAAGSLLDAYRAPAGAVFRLVVEPEPDLAEHAVLGAGDELVSGWGSPRALRILHSEGYVLWAWPAQCAS